MAEEALKVFLLLRYCGYTTLKDSEDLDIEASLQIKKQVIICI